jgi:hypothetical protein
MTATTAAVETTATAATTTSTSTAASTEHGRLERRDNSQDRQDADGKFQFLGHGFHRLSTCDESAASRLLRSRRLADHRDCQVGHPFVARQAVGRVPDDPVRRGPR